MNLMNGSSRVRRALSGRTWPVLVVAAWLLGMPAPAAGAPEPDPYLEPPTLAGMSGLINTPTADVLPSGAVRFGAMVIDKQWAEHARGLTDNDHYFLSVGLLPRLEVTFRASLFPHDRLTRLVDEEGTVDRGGSARFLVLEEGSRIPAVAVGIDDARGTRRFHALYIVGTKSITIDPGRATLRLSGGYGSTALDAFAHLLDGGFGGAEIVVADRVSWALDFDTEKWNTCLRLIMFRRLAANFAFLNLESPAGGLSWTERF